MLKSGVVEDDAYDAAGNVLDAKLKGSGRTAYQLKVTGVPAGYLVTSPFALTGGAAPNHEALSARAVDSNFTKSGEAYLSERFYLPIDGDDLTYDLGLIRVRDLEIQKRGTDNRALSGVQFKIYGPFTDAQLASNAGVSGENEIATLTTDASGKASFVSAGSLYLNYYENYVVVETVAAQHYDAAQLTVSGGDPAAVSSYTVTGDGISGANCFVLPAKSGEEATRTWLLPPTSTWPAAR
jgi:hypothetical protein